jgi:hypothetical protein
MNHPSNRALGRSDLIVSLLALEKMTFDTEWWGAGAKASRAFFDN